MFFLIRAADGGGTAGSGVGGELTSKFSSAPAPWMLRPGGLPVFFLNSTICGKGEIQPNERGRAEGRGGEELGGACALAFGAD